MYYLTFSDAAKYADVARNILEGRGFVSSFSFFSQNVFNFNGGYFSASSIPKLYPYLLSIVFRLFGVTDFSVLMLSWFFFILTITIGFLLANKLFGKITAIIFSLSLSFNLNLIDFARTGASEMFFIFLLLTSIYLLLFDNKKVQISGLFVSILMYFTRPQAILFIIPVFILFLLQNYSIKKTIKYLLIISISFLVFDIVIFKTFTGRSLLYPFIVRGLEASRYYYPGEGTSARLRGGNVVALTNIQIIKKTIYNLYNFYRLIPNYMSPYMFAIFVLSLVRWSKKKIVSSFKIFVLVLALVVYLSTALTIPLLRYLIPIVPFFYLFSSKTLVEMVAYFLRLKSSNTRFNFKNFYISFVILFFFVIAPTLGVLLLDSRSEADKINKNKPPAYKILSEYLKNNTQKEDLILTNLDTWGSWYGERKTVWYPIEPKMVFDAKTDKTPFDYIYLTSYRIDDENYYMGDKWRNILQEIGNEDYVLGNSFKVVKSFDVSQNQVYENTQYKAVLLKNNNHLDNE